MMVSACKFLQIIQLAFYFAAETCRADVARVVSAAAEDSVHDLEAAVAALVDYERSPRLQLSLEARYVQALLQLRSQDNISRDKAALTLLLPSNVALHVHTKGSDSDGRMRLQRQVERYAEELGIGLEDGHWAADSEDEAVREKYAAALEEVRGGLIAYYQRLVEDQAFKLKVMLQNRGGVQGKNAIQMDKSIKAIRR